MHRHFKKKAFNNNFATRLTNASSAAILFLIIKMVLSIRLENCHNNQTPYILIVSFILALHNAYTTHLCSTYPCTQYVNKKSNSQSYKRSN